MVERLNRKLDRYVAEATLPAAAVPDIVRLCRRMRALNDDSTIGYWIGAIERHAAEIRDPSAPSEEIGSLPWSAQILSSYLHLLKDVHNLRTWLMQPQEPVEPQPRPPEWQQMSLV
jgi:hypothetical protein